MPRLLDTHRPDAFELAIRAGNKPANQSSPRGLPADSQASGGEPQTALRLALRVFRPALHARVRLAGIAPRQVIAPGVKRDGARSGGPVEDFRRMVDRHAVGSRGMGCRA